MDEVTRRSLLAVTAAGGVLAAAGSAGAQTSEATPQPLRPGHGGSDPGPRNVVRDRQNPDLLVPPSTDHGTLPNLRFSSGLSGHGCAAQEGSACGARLGGQAIRLRS